MVILFVNWFLQRQFPRLWPLLLVQAAQLLISCFWAYAAQGLYYRVFGPKKTAVICDMREGMEKMIEQYGLTGKYDVKASLSVTDCLKDDMKALQDGEIEAAFLCGVHSHERNILLKYCVMHDIDVYVIPRVGDVIMSGARRMHMFHLPVLMVRRYTPTPEFYFVKRLFDVVASGLALVLLSPVMLAVAIAIRSDGGPAFYKQVRLTTDGRKFRIIKFRSMRVDAEKDGKARLSTGDSDDRVTKVGRVIRKVRLDELPQLINIFKGDMSFVGPRPERPEIAAEYEKELPEFSLRLQAKAGLTGYAQVYGQYNTTPYDKLQMDLQYISHPSLWEDLRIILATIKILFQKESTEGVAEGQQTALQSPARGEKTQG
jgi:exopolysaccharide biosynthesis polyprenyl glycosylphosphotransferase